MAAHYKLTPAASKFVQLRELGRFSRAGVALAAMAAFAALVIFGPVGPKAALWDETSSGGKSQTWAGHLESPTGQSSAAAPLTSASYTSGFDRASLAPMRAAKPQARDAHACPDGLNCAFRGGKARHPEAVAAASAVPTPPANPVAAAPAPATPAAPAAPAIAVAAPAPAPQQNGLMAFAARLASPHTLLKPFTFVADTFTGFMRKL
ncbi:MAG TPA: hypothetical protein VKV77_00485 [Methylovirgula sp.]|nr:hypothetical protein [Methylovirgula sp.]